MARSKHTRRKKNMNGGKLLLWLIAVVLVLILVFNFSAVKNHLDMLYGLAGGIILMTITNTLNDFQSKKEEQEEFKELCRMYIR